MSDVLGCLTLWEAPGGSGRPWAGPGRLWEALSGLRGSGRLREALGGPGEGEDATLKQGLAVLVLLRHIRGLRGLRRGGIVLVLLRHIRGLRGLRTLALHGLKDCGDVLFPRWQREHNEWPLGGGTCLYSADRCPGQNLLCLLRHLPEPTDPIHAVTWIGTAPPVFKGDAYACKDRQRGQGREGSREGRRE